MSSWGKTLTTTTWKIAAAYVGGIVGAGFASGQEIVQFFALFGRNGLLGALGATVLLALLGRIFMQLAYTGDTRSHRELLAEICGRKWAVYFDLALALFLLGTLAIMIAGSGALMQEYLQSPSYYGSLAISAGVLLILAFGVNGFLAWNLALVAVLLGITVLIGSAALIGYGPGWMGPLKPGLPAIKGGMLIPNWWIAAVLYTSYNSSLMLALAASIGRARERGTQEKIPAGQRKFALGRELASSGEFALGGLLGGICLGSLVFFMAVVLLSAGEGAIHSPLPMYAIARVLGPLPHYGYVLSLWIAMWSTATSCTYSLSRRIAEMLGLNWRVAAGLAVGIAFALARIGFSELIRTVYPAFGYIWLIFLLLLARYRLGGRTCTKPPRQV
ncbi:MAG: hypothetical protein ACM3TT_12275 [Syntrophothermus sp.]